MAIQRYLVHRSSPSGLSSGQHIFSVWVWLVLSGVGKERRKQTALSSLPGLSLSCTVLPPDLNVCCRDEGFEGVPHYGPPCMFQWRNQGFQRNWLDLWGGGRTVVVLGKVGVMEEGWLGGNGHPEASLPALGAKYRQE